VVLTRVRDPEEQSRTGWLRTKPRWQHLLLTLLLVPQALGDEEVVGLVDEVEDLVGRRVSRRVVFSTLLVRFTEFRSTPTSKLAWRRERAGLVRASESCGTMLAWRKQPLLTIHVGLWYLVCACHPAERLSTCCWTLRGASGG